MRIVDIRERSVAISRYDDPSIPSGGLTTSMLAVVTDVLHGGEPIVGFGFGSIGRYAQSGLIRERFAPRLLEAPTAALLDEMGNLDPLRAWDLMMKGEKPGGHGERCVAVGTLDMALWDAAAKIAELPLYRHLSDRIGRTVCNAPAIQVYSSGGYLFPQDDTARLRTEMGRVVDLGFTHAKIKISTAPLAEDLRRIEVAAATLGDPGCLAVDAMNAYDQAAAMAAACEFAPLQLWWFEDACDPLDFTLQSEIAAMYAAPLGGGEALFSLAEAKLLHLYGGYRADRDTLLFDPVHCYGLPGYLQIVDYFEAGGWPRKAFWPHGGHLFSVHVAAALGLGGAELNPFSFSPFGGWHDEARVQAGRLSLPQEPGIGFERKQALHAAFRLALEV